jgi:hypothetical protein
MADIALKTTNASSQTGNNSATLDVEESIEQMTLPAAVDMNEGTPVYVNSSAQFAKGDASVSGTTNGLYGITVRKVKAGEPVTAIAKGVVGGFTFTQAYGALIYLSDTEGRIGDAAGTVSKVVGMVIPAYGQPRGTSAAKLLRVNL